MDEQILFHEIKQPEVAHRKEVQDRDTGGEGEAAEECGQQLRVLKGKLKLRSHVRLVELLLGDCLLLMTRDIHVAVKTVPFPHFISMASENITHLDENDRYANGIVPIRGKLCRTRGGNTEECRQQHIVIIDEKDQRGVDVLEDKQAQKRRFSSCIFGVMLFEPGQTLQHLFDQNVHQQYAEGGKVRQYLGRNILTSIVGTGITTKLIDRGQLVAVATQLVGVVIHPGNFLRGGEGVEVFRTQLGRVVVGDALFCVLRREYHGEGNNDQQKGEKGGQGPALEARPPTVGEILPQYSAGFW
mmetsp:Transcript_27364/g.45899  ORF Transcript_27364/g.45899 Transcript_27364/m.45899 type:complete len:300 (-) Transcript_27364:2075-2974(-)